MSGRMTDKDKQAKGIDHSASEGQSSVNQADLRHKRAMHQSEVEDVACTFAAFSYNDSSSFCSTDLSNQMNLKPSAASLRSARKLHQ